MKEYTLNRVLLIEDDIKIAQLLQEFLAQYDFEVVVAHDGLSGRDRALGEDFKLILLDLMLPQLDGLSVFREVRKVKETPIIMLTARGDVTDRIVGLELGADDYLPKPFEPRELVARMTNVLKRNQGNTLASDAPMVRDDLTIDRKRFDAFRDGEPIHLTAMEFELLYLLASEPHRHFDRDAILNALRGVDADIYSRSVDILISRLRKKLGDKEYIHTARGKGYAYTGLDGAS